MLQTFCHQPLRNLVTSEEIHSQTTERFWRDLKEWIKRPGMKSKYMHQYLARYLFVSSVSDKTTRVHQYFYPSSKIVHPFISPRASNMPQPVETDSSSEDDEEPQKKKKITG